MQSIIWKNYQPQYQSIFDGWQQREVQLGVTGLEDYVAIKGESLGQYLTLIAQDLGMPCKVAFIDNELVGFVCYEEQSEGVIHIELFGINPDLRGKSYAKLLLHSLKEQLQLKQSFKELNLSVHENNIAGIKAFNKIGTQQEDRHSDNYIDFVL